MSELHLRKLLIYSSPLILGSLLEPLASIVDTAFIGRWGTTELAALAIGVTIFNSFSWVFNFLVHIPMESVAKATLGKREQLITQQSFQDNNSQERWKLVLTHYILY